MMDIVADIGLLELMFIWAVVIFASLLRCPHLLGGGASKTNVSISFYGYYWDDIGYAVVKYYFAAAVPGLGWSCSHRCLCGTNVIQTQHLQG